MKKFYIIKNKRLSNFILICILLSLVLSITSFITFSKSRLFLVLIVLLVFVLTFKRIRLGIYLVAASLPLIPRLTLKSGIANFSIAELILLVVLLNWIISRLINKQKKLRKTMLDKPIALFLILTIISFFISLKYFSLPLTFISSASNLYPLKILLNTIEYLLFFYLIVNILEKKDIKILLYISLVSFLIVSAYGIFQSNNPLSLINLFTLNSKLNAVSTFRSPNTLATYLILFIPLIFYFLKDKTYKIVVGIISFLCLFYTISRGAIVALYLSFLIHFKKNKKNIILFSIISSALILFIFILNNPLILFNGTSRIDIFKNSINTILQNPVGIGLGSFRIANVGGGAHHAHNLYLQIAVERGIFTLISFFWIFYIFFKDNSYTKLKKEFRGISTALVIGISAVLIHGFVDYVFYEQRVALLFWMLIGTVIIIKR